MSTIKVFVIVFACSSLQGYPQSITSAYADLGQSGAITFEEAKDGLKITDTLRGLKSNLSYDIHLLSTKCPETAPLDDTKIRTLQQSRQKARKLVNIDDKGRRSIASLNGLNISNIMSKGLLLSQAHRPVHCA